MFREGLGQQKQGVLPAFSLSAVSIFCGAHNAEFGACIKRRRNICLKSAPLCGSCTAKTRSVRNCWHVAEACCEQEDAVWCTHPNLVLQTILEIPGKRRQVVEPGDRWSVSRGDTLIFGNVRCQVDIGPAAARTDQVSS